MATGERMSETRALLERIAALRQRLDQAQHYLSQATVAATRLPPGEGERPELAAVAESRVQALLETSLRHLAGVIDGPDVVRTVPLTARARRAFESARELVGHLRGIADDPALKAADADDPLALCWRELVTMLETAIRFARAFPESPSSQLRLCEGLDGILAGIADRVGGLRAAVEQRRTDCERVGSLARCLVSLWVGDQPALEPFTALAEHVVRDARQGEPLRITSPPPLTPAVAAAGGWLPRFVAGHSWNCAQVAVRLARHSPELRDRLTDVVLAALLHDVAMLGLPLDAVGSPEQWATPQRSILFGHPREGAEVVAKHLPDAAHLADAIAGHHERPDGSGYPTGAGTGLALAKVLAVADTYAAMIAHRPHRPALDPRTALTDTLMLAERGALDRETASWLMDLSFYPVGSVVELTDGSVGLVIATHPPSDDVQTPARPVLAILADAEGELLASPKPLDLARVEGRAIVRSVPVEARRQLLGRRYPELVV